MKKSNKIKRLVIKYIWAGPIIGFAMGVATNLLDFHFKSRSSNFEQIKLENDLHERLQNLNSDISASELKYISLRDQFFQNWQVGDHNQYPLQNEFSAAKANLLSLFNEYNSIQINLALIEGTSPNFFVLNIPPPTPRLHVEIISTNKEGALSRLVAKTQSDPLVTEAQTQLSLMFKQHGHAYPKDDYWHDENARLYNPTNIGINFYMRRVN
jgi:hypothetical protein